VIAIAGENRLGKRSCFWRTLFLFIIYEMLFIAMTAPIFIFYGPFDNLKRTIVGTAMSTMRHRYIATTFLSQEEIDKILGKSNGGDIYPNLDEDLSNIQVCYPNNTEIDRYNIHTNKFDGYILEIKDPTRIRVGHTKRLGKEGQTVSEIAKENGAIAAINGGAFADRSNDGKMFAGTGAYPGGLVMSKGKVVYSDLNPDSKVNVIAFNGQGILLVGDHSINELKNLGVVEALSFRPPTLIINGKGQIHKEDGNGLDPRTAIGQKKDGTIIFLVIDGRSGFKLGASLYDVQEIMLQHGAWNAGNLDGGSSSTMYYNGEVINNPSDWDGERTVATALYVRH